MRSPPRASSEGVGDHARAPECSTEALDHLGPQWCNPAPAIEVTVMAMSSEDRKEMNKRCARLSYENNRPKFMHRSAKVRARKTGVAFDIAVEDIKIPDNCPICHVKLTYTSDYHTAPSLDKVNPELGYIRGNIDVLCARCNRRKNDSTIENLERILHYMKSKASETL